MANLKRDMAILATSGRGWAERTKRLGSRVPDLDIFSRALIERLNGGWRITDKGRAVLALMEARPPAANEASTDIPVTSPVRRPCNSHSRGAGVVANVTRRPPEGTGERFVTEPARLFGRQQLRQPITLDFPEVADLRPPWRLSP
jgi:hypothetical protein